MAAKHRSKKASRRRPWLWAAGGVLVVVAALATGLWLGRTTLAERAIIAALEERGLAPVTLRVEDVTAGRARITGVRIGREAPIRIREVIAEFDPEGLAAGHLRRIVINGLRLAGTVRQDRISLGHLDPLLAAGQGGVSIPVDEVVIQAARVTLQSPVGPAEVKVDGRLRATEDGAIKGRFRVEITSAFGTVPGRLDLQIPAAGTLSGSLVLSSARLTFKGATVAGLGGRISFTARGRMSGRLAVARFQLSGADTAMPPLTKGTLRFAYTPRGGLLLHHMTWRFAGGTLSAKNTRLDPAAPRNVIVVDVDGVDAAELAKITKSKIFSATGKLKGRIPLVIEGSRVAVRDGRLAAIATGVIRYRSGMSEADLKAKRPEIAMMIQALENFEYRSATVAMDQKPGGKGVIRIHLDGRNPDFLNGKRFVLNLNLEGDFGEVIDCFVERRCSAEQIGEMLLQFLK